MARILVHAWIVLDVEGRIRPSFRGRAAVEERSEFYESREKRLPRCGLKCEGLDARLDLLAKESQLR